MKTPMNSMISEKNVYSDKPSEERLSRMFQVTFGKLLSGTEKKRAETLYWYIHTFDLETQKKN